MHKIILMMLGCVLVFSCTKPKTTIALNTVGKITNSTTIKDLKHLFAKDSIVSILSEGDLGNVNDYVGDNDSHLIYQKGGELLLSISPINPLDSVSKIKSVTVFSHIYSTKEGVSLQSTFNEVNMHHTIDKLEASFNTVTVFVKDINATFTMDKSNLGIPTFTLGEVKKSQIPDNTKITSLTVWFEE